MRERDSIWTLRQRAREAFSNLDSERRRRLLEILSADFEALGYGEQDDEI